MAGAGDGVPVLLVTANVGSIFEEPSTMLKIWTEEFLSTVLRLDPKFIALHCQEVGGKNYEQSMKHVEEFVRLLMSSEELRLFDKVRVFLDEDFSSAEHFTALGNLYFVHDSVKEVLLWDFKDCTFVPADGKEVHSGNIETVTTKEKAKFPQDFFPECKWSRKGFLRTRWSIGGTVFDLINIHLFHDASNFIAMETFPSVYSKTRRRALEHTLDRFHNDKYPNVPYFLFGDFNFRTDTAGVIKKLTEDTQEKIFSNKGSISKLQFRNKEDDLILTLGKKEFSHCDHENVFIKNGGEWLREYDRELEDFQGRLYEFPIMFMPSYPFEEDVNEATNYMHTRVPAWCDRVLLSPTARMLVQDTDSRNAAEYGIIGPTTCMGDHKPVYLRAMIVMNAGTIECCSLPAAPMYCFRVPASYMELLSILPDCSSYASARGFYSSERSSNLLHAIPIKHDPYTPDSMDSPSPNTLTASGEAPDIFCNRREFYAAVPPALLKSKLELIVQSKRQEEQDLAKQEYQDDLSKDPAFRRANQRSCGRRKRSNSDVSSHSSSLAHATWLSVDKSTHRGYRSFGDFVTDQSRHDLPLDQVIPKIAIINASNFESNESSVFSHDDRLDSENKLNSSSRIDKNSSSGRDCTNIDDDNGTSTQCLSKDFLTMKYNGDYLNVEGNDNVRLRAENMRAEQDNRESVSRNTYMDEDTIHNQHLDLANEEAGDNNVTGHPKNDEEIVDFQESLRRTTKLVEERLTTPRVFSVKSSEQTGLKETNFGSVHESPCITVEERCGGQKVRVSNVICSDALTRKPSCNDIEVFGPESRQEMITSKNSTRSNSIESQDIGDNGGSVKLKLKAYKVTERYTNNIVGKQGKCHGCCCAVS